MKKIFPEHRKIHLPASLRKLARSLREKKVRDETRLFLVEGEKMVLELLKSDYRIAWIAATESWIREQGYKCAQTDLYEVEESLLAGISGLKTPNRVLAVVHMPETPVLQIPERTDLCLVLDGVQDPGNTGTILRLADWFDIRYVVLGETSADSFNTKTVQASMGSIFRVHVIRTDAAAICRNMQRQGWNIYGMDLQGTNLYKAELKLPAMIVLGNESRGLSKEISREISQFLTIPRGGPGSGAESLNVGMAAAIVCAEFRRRFPG
ncbi:MAG: TrmH family RNA methyltransferase [Bacteroidales bacterium]